MTYLNLEKYTFSQKAIATMIYWPTVMASVFKFLA